MRKTNTHDAQIIPNNRSFGGINFPGMDF